MGVRSIMRVDPPLPTKDADSPRLVVYLVFGIGPMTRHRSWDWSQYNPLSTLDMDTQRHRLVAQRPLKSIRVCVMLETSNS